MALATVYNEGPSASTVCAWKQIVQVNGASLVKPLTIGTDGASYHWRVQLNGDSWVDPFQKSPEGGGYLSLLAYAYSGGHDSNGTIGPRAFDMRGARLTCQVRAQSLRLGPTVNLFFWMQFRDVRAQLGQGRYVNVSYLGQTVDNLLGYTAPFERAAQQTITSDWKTLVVNFDTSKPWEWIHNGSATDKTAIYDSNPSHVLNADQVFRHWDWDCGFLAVYPTDPVAADFPYGELNFRNLKLEVDDALNDTTVPAQPPSPVVAASATASVGSPITITVVNGPANNNDWVGLYAAGQPDNTYINWLYLNGTQTKTVGFANATFTLTAPASSGVYDVRLFASGGLTKLATSGAITIG